jgi:hypothetical protein
METVEIPIVNKAITNVVLRPTYHHNGQILLNQGAEKEMLSKTWPRRVKTDWYCPPKEKQLGKTRTAALA